ncbi:helix-turn-helix transcriptional regulator [Bariatricus massiliensis]|uniref:Helix-turn-helix transcriptional regulator n=1 Tax=Bariatricus massiliensis TaxID=1745713 RepID=A0ABS8DJE8_9FIRM|nr:helix-turn-helix transcriptional regulator [Bariatricus massiliensis]MCB7305367.1 helix-turn-helix transcriptional regulator [Bariatricus massiliensis]MCB7375921.1 helix-turn-helix transcriptional regulator [Bariatricus massiliensis]MCB7388510.1 helix-turn-helix transcriptional regulator [Bariatricus massiliensis]MCB7412683.1 helix-turn-helix transcriptional regulator [Bariatricus massiliensis]MCQ5252101.1 helix-turn-helix transcriptional regulator [Bariatricus massiliensis]
MDFSTILKELRESREITQDELAKQLRVSRPTIAGYETKHRQPDYDKLIMISEIFNVSIDYLLTGKTTEELTPAPSSHRNEKMLDRKVINAYKQLGFDEKEDVLDYIHLLKLKKKYEVDK